MLINWYKPKHLICFTERAKQVTQEHDNNLTRFGLYLSCRLDPVSYILTFPLDVKGQFEFFIEVVGLQTLL